MLVSNMKSRGKLGVRHFTQAKSAPLSWKLRNILRPSYVWNLFTYYGMKALSAITGVISVTGRISARLIHADGTSMNYGVVGHGLVTTAFITFLIDSMVTSDTTFADFKFHDSGVGVIAAAIGDTDMGTTDGETRVTGTQVDVDPIYRSVGTITYTTTKAITEHGLFNIVTGGTMIDRHVFTAINVVNTDQIEFTYEWTANSGG